jgi:hypothetical protein
VLNVNQTSLVLVGNKTMCKKLFISKNIIKIKMECVRNDILKDRLIGSK